MRGYLTNWRVRCERCGRVAICHVLLNGALVCGACIRPDDPLRAPATEV